MTRAVHLDKTQLSNAVIAETQAGELAENAVRLRVESFSVTANNVTYAVVGDGFGYWNFFPAPDGKGIVPMWGHAVVEHSNHPEFTIGQRVYGYLPMATHLDVLPGKISDSSFMDVADHRQPMSPIYNQYTRLSHDPEHDAAREAERMIFGPLFKTGYLIQSMFHSEDWFGAEAMVVTSASSKTAMATISVTRDKSPHIRRIGLTSPGNVAFTKATGLYDEVLSYDECRSVSSGTLGIGRFCRECERAARDPSSSWRAYGLFLPGRRNPYRSAGRRHCFSARTGAGDVLRSDLRGCCGKRTGAEAVRAGAGKELAQVFK